MENMQSDHVKRRQWKKQRSRIFLVYENKYTTHLKMAM
jgi:hypothetical protein